MKIIPAIDILNGKVVRLLKGDFDFATEYSNTPLDSAKKFQQLGFNHLHLIDLSGAKEGTTFIADLIPEIVELGVTVQVGGGIRTFADAEDYIVKGVSKLIVSTASLLDESFYKKLLDHFSEDRIVLSLDVVNGAVAIKGWKETLDMTVYDVIEKLKVKHVIVTDISRDGTLSGVNLGFYRDLATRYPKVNLIAAGGVCSLEAIKQLEEVGVKGAVIGRAFYEDEEFQEEVVEYHRKGRLGES